MRMITTTAAGNHRAVAVTEGDEVFMLMEVRSRREGEDMAVKKEVRKRGEYLKLKQAIHELCTRRH